MAEIDGRSGMVATQGSAAADPS